MPNNLGELIRTGQIDITSREAVENETDRERRAAEPGAYALTYEEHINVLRASNFVETVLSQSDLFELEAIFYGEAITPDIATKIKEAFKKNGLDPDQLHTLASRVLSGNWYIILISQHYAPDNEGEPGFFLLANVDGETKQGILSAEDFPSIYNGSTIKEQKIALHLPENAGYLYSTEYISLSFFLNTLYGNNEICTHSKGKDNLLLQHFLPMLNGNPTNSIMGMSPKYLEADGITGIATYKKDGCTIKIEDFSDVSAHLGTSAKKLMDTSVLYLTDANYYKSDAIDPSAIIPLDQYWRVQKYRIDPVDNTPDEQARVENLVKWLKKGIRADCQALMSISWEGYMKTGKEKTQVASYHFISSWRFLKGNRLKINFDIDLAKYLVHAYQMQFPVSLLSLDNRKANAYAIGRKIALHHSMDNNAISGTDNTVSVKSLLAAAPEIPSYDVVLSKKQGGWKTRIKKLLEAALDDDVATGYLSRWEYRNPRAKSVTIYTPAEAAQLSWEEYYSLVVDFTLSEEPDQDKRRARRAAEKAAAAKSPAKKRGRPKKTVEKG